MKLWIATALLILVVIIVAQNTEVVTVRFLFWEASLSRVVLLLLTLVIGMAIGFIGAKVPKNRSSSPKKGK